MICSIGRKHTVRFEDFIPEEVLKNVGKPGIFTIGMFDEIVNMEPVGFAQFYAGCPKKYGSKEVFILTWFYVKEGERYDGNGSALLNEIVSLAEKSGSSEVIIKLGEEHDEFMEFLKKRRFVFKEEDEVIVEKVAEEFVGLDFMKYAETDKIRPLNSLSEEEIAYLEKETEPDVFEDLKAIHSEEGSVYDPELSSAFEEGNRIHALMLVKGPCPDKTEISGIHGFEGFKPLKAVSFFKYLEEMIGSEIPTESVIRITAGDDEFGTLYKRWFPEHETQSIMVGRYKV